MNDIILCLVYKSEQIRVKHEKPFFPLQRNVLTAHFLPVGFSNRTVVKQLPKKLLQPMHFQREHMGATIRCKGAPGIL